MKRRTFIAGLGSAAAWPVVAWGQQSSVPVIGWLNVWAPQQIPAYLTGFRKGLDDGGFVEGKNVAIEFRWTDRLEQLPIVAADLVRRQVALIVADTNSMQAAKAATTSIPIIFISSVDPVNAGLVTSLNRPGSNVTGATFLSRDLLPKKLELLHEAVPKATIIGALVNPALSITARDTEILLETARTLGLELQILNASRDEEIDAAFEFLTERRAGALLIQGGLFFSSRTAKLAMLAAAPTGE